MSERADPVIAQGPQDRRSTPGVLSRYPLRRGRGDDLESSSPSTEPGQLQMAARRVSHAALRVLLREVREGSHPDGVHRRARTRRLQVPGLWGQGAEAAHGHILFPDLEESLRRHLNMEGKADGSPQTTYSAPRNCAGAADCEAHLEEWTAGRRAVSPRAVHRSLVSLSLSHLAQAQPRGDCNALGPSTRRSSATSTGEERWHEGNGRMIPWPAQHDCDAAGESARPAGGRDGRPSEQGKNFLMNDVPAGAASRSSSR